MNTLYYGDNLDVLRRFIKDESVDLCYIDTWTWDDHAIECRDDILSNKNNVQTSQSIALIAGLEKALGRRSLFERCLC